MIVGIVGWEIGGTLRFDVDGVPGDGAGRFYVEEGVIASGEGSVSGVRVRIPFSDEAFVEGDGDGDGGFAGGIEKEDGSLRARCAAHSDLARDFAEVLHEERQAAGSRVRK